MLNQLKWKQKRNIFFRVASVGAMIGSTWALIAAATAAEGQGTSFKFKMKGDRFSLELVQRFDVRKSLDEVRAVFSDHRLLPQISNLITDADVRRIDDTSYFLETTGTKKVEVGVKFEKSARTVNRCSEKSGPTFWERRCTLALDRGDTGTFLAGGKSSLRCEEGTGRDAAVVCVSKTEAQPKPIRYWPVYVRTPQQLAAAGARESLHDMGVLFMIANTSLTPARAKAEFDGSRLDKLSTRMFEEARAIADRKELGTRSLQVNASEQSGAYELRME